MLLGLSTSFGLTDARAWAKKHYDLGCKAVVFPCNCYDSPQTIDAFASAAKEYGLVIAEVGVWKNTLAADTKEREEAIRYAIGQLKLADKIGANCCVNIIGTPYGPRWDGAYPGNYTEETWNMAIPMIQRIIDEAAPKHTKYSIETMPWMYPSSPDEYARMIDEVDREAFGVHMDFINMVNCPERYFFPEQFLRESFEKLKGKIVSCHIKDVKLLDDFTFQLRECACGEGTMPLELYAELATLEDPLMPMIIEHLHSDEQYLENLVYTQNRLKDYLK